MTNAQPPEWYKTDEIEDAIRRGTFFHKGKTVEESVAAHLQNALKKGFDMGRRVDPTSENARLREALKKRVMIWDSHERDYILCDLCSNAESQGHKQECVLA
jgi:hypothetical protein